MTDITMCFGVERHADATRDRKCPNRSTCHRHTAEPDTLRQSYFAKLPIAENGECPSYWPTKEQP